MTNAKALLNTTIREARSALISGQVTSRELTQAALDRISTYDNYYGAFVAIDAQAALSQADQADDLRKDGKAVGVLLGIPIAIKDIIGTKNMASRCGSVIDEQLLPLEDAKVVTNLRAAGAIILGKVATTEFALSGYHPDYTPPQNPWGHDLWAGVSSSGSGVSTATGMAFGALGSDTGGSVRFPAAVNGVVGLKPTFGRLSLEGVFPLAPSLDHIGVFARSVEDAAIMFNGAFGRDEILHDQYIFQPVRIGVDNTFIEAHAHPEVAQAICEAVKKLEELGHEIVPVDMSFFADLAALWGATTALEAQEKHGNLFAVHAADYGPVFADLLRQGQAITQDVADSLIAAREAGTAQMKALLSEVELLALPSAPLPAMPLSEFPPQAILPAENVVEFVTFVAAMNFSGHPTISAPCGFSSEGLPLSLQLVGQMEGEKSIIDVMAAYEAATQWHQRRPTLRSN